MTEFVASNGLRISALPDGQVRLSRSIPGDSREQVAWMTPGEAVALREFFAAHPEPKPWHDAKPGELWMLTVYGAEHEFFIRSDGGSKIFAHRLDTSAEYPITGDAGVITAGRRIWPES